MTDFCDSADEMQGFLDSLRSLGMTDSVVLRSLGMTESLGTGGQRGPKASRMVSVRTTLPRDLDIFDSSKRSQPLATTDFGSHLAFHSASGTSGGRRPIRKAGQ